MPYAQDTLSTTENKVLTRIQRKGRGSVIVPADFLSLTSRRVVDVSLHRLVKKGKIQRLTRGVYYYPRLHPKLGPLQPRLDEVAKALAGKERIRLQPAGSYAANLLGLSEQVPAKVVFLTEGPSRTLRIGNQTLQLRHTTPRNMAAAGRLSGLLIQALRELGRHPISANQIAHLKATLPAEERRKLLKDLPLAPAWMHPIFRELAG